jgi:O-antigen/teichoic acid export membrane protein
MESARVTATTATFRQSHHGAKRFPVSLTREVVTFLSAPQVRARVPATHHPSPVAPERDRAVRLTIIAATGAKIFSVLCTLAQVPLALHALGPDAYGLWITLAGLTVLFNFVDFGLGVGMQRGMAEAFGRGDDALVRRTFLTGALALGALGLGVLTVGLPVALFVPWGPALRITNPVLLGQISPALALTLVAWALALPFNAVSRLAAAVQRGWLHAGWIAAGSALSLAATAWIAHTGGGLLTFLIVTAAVPILSGLGLWIHLAINRRWPWLGVALLSRSEFRTLLGASALFTPAQLGLALTQAAPPIALTLAAGPAAATAFNLLQRLFSPLAQAQVIIFTPLWPALAEAHTRGDATWVRRATVRAFLITGALALAVAVVTALAPALLTLWVGPAVVPPPASFAWLACLWTVLQMAVLAVVYLLVALGRLRAVALHATFGCALGLAGLFVGAHAGTDATLLGGCCGLALGLPGLIRAARHAWPLSA